MLVLHFLRTEKMPFLQSSASGIMTLVTTARIVLGTVLPFTTFGAELGFVGLSPSYFLYLIPTIVAYWHWLRSLKFYTSNVTVNYCN